MIVQGKTDDDYAPAALEKLGEIPGKELVTILDAGHACYKDNPDSWHKNLKGFLSKLV